MERRGKKRRKERRSDASIEGRLECGKAACQKRRQLGLWESFTVNSKLAGSYNILRWLTRCSWEDSMPTDWYFGIQL